MRSLPRILRASAPLALALALVACGGGGHGGGGSSLPSTPAGIAAASFKNANVAGDFDTPDKVASRAGTKTTVTIQFANDNTSGNGVASFVTGSAADPTNFAAYAADISNLHYDADTVPTGPNTKGSGKVTFILSNFTANKYFSGTASFGGTYVADYRVDAVTKKQTLQLTLTGTFTGKDGNGAATAASTSMGYQAGVANIDLSGTYSGSASYLTAPVYTFTNQSVGKPTGDGLHLSATLPLPGGASLAYSGVYTRGSLSGGTKLPADLSIPVPILGAIVIPKDSTVQIYLSTPDFGKTVTGNLIATEPDKTTVVLNLKATKTSSDPIGGGAPPTGGSTTNLKTGYYDGGLATTSGALTGGILKLNVVKSSATTGGNGAAVFVYGPNYGYPNVGARIASVARTAGLNDPDKVTITLDTFSANYSKFVIDGTLSGSGFSAASYTATTLDNRTETGTISQLGQGTTTTSSFKGTFKGTLTDSGGKKNDFTGDFTPNADGTVSVFTRSTLDDIPYPGFFLYVAGNSFAAFARTDSLTTPTNYAGDSFYAEFSGDLSGSTITGLFDYQVYKGSSSIHFEEGPLSLTKQ